jgi:hypothetical protein
MEQKWIPGGAVEKVRRHFMTAGQRENFTPLPWHPFTMMVFV